MDVKKIEWSKPVLRVLGSSLVTFTLGRCETGGTPNQADNDLCTLGNAAIVTCTSGVKAGSQGSCTYGPGAF